MKFRVGDILVDAEKKEQLEECGIRIEYMDAHDYVLSGMASEDDREIAEDTEIWLDRSVSKKRKSKLKEFEESPEATNLFAYCIYGLLAVAGVLTIFGII